LKKYCLLRIKTVPIFGRIRDNSHLNTTDNPLADDLIGLAKLRYKILNYKDNAYKIEVKIPENDLEIINI
jgi:hypothetical protein